jgi:DNA-binding GntR family transcriptional regulator
VTVPKSGKVEDGELERISTVDALVKAIGGRVLDGSYAPGEALREPELCKQFGVSRHSLRTALQALAHDGLVRLIANRGAFVPSFDVADMRDLYLLRTILECGAIERLGLAEPAALEPVQASVEALEAVPASATWGEMRDADMAFHRAIVDSIESPRVSRAHASVISESRLCLRQLRAEYEDHALVVAQHKEILQALLDRRPDQARQLLQDHLDETWANLLETQGAGLTMETASGSRPPAESPAS